MKLINYTLAEIMDSPLPPIQVQRRLPYRPSKSDVKHVYRELNKLVFDSELSMPRLILASHCRKYWGICMGDVELQQDNSYCTIKLMDKWFCPQWMVTTLAHEMCHQYQWDIEGPKREKNGKQFLMSHGPSFFAHRDRLAAHGISLRTSHGQKRWFKHQDLFKC